MKFSQGLKVVSYLNELLIVPHWTKYISIDKNGDMFAWEIKPTRNSSRWYIYKDKRFQHLGVAELIDTVWTKTLRKME